MCGACFILTPLLLLGNEKGSESTEERRNGEEERASLGSFQTLNQMGAGSRVMAAALPWEAGLCGLHRTTFPPREDGPSTSTVLFFDLCSPRRRCVIFVGVLVVCFFFILFCRNEGAASRGAVSLPPSAPSPSRPQRKHQAGMRMLTTGWWVFRSAAFQNEASLTSERGKRARSIEFLDNFVLREMGSDVRLTYKETLRGQPQEFLLSALLPSLS